MIPKTVFKKKLKKHGVVVSIHESRRWRFIFRELFIEGVEAALYSFLVLTLGLIVFFAALAAGIKAMELMGWAFPGMGV